MVFLIPLLEEFGWSRANTAGAFAVAIFIEALGGIYAGRMADRLGIRRVVFGCGILIAVACIGMSFIQNLWQLYLCYGLFLGLGLSFTYAPPGLHHNAIIFQQTRTYDGDNCCRAGCGFIDYNAVS